MVNSSNIQYHTFKCVPNSCDGSCFLGKLWAHLSIVSGTKVVSFNELSLHLSGSSMFDMMGKSQCWYEMSSARCVETTAMDSAALQGLMFYCCFMCMIFFGSIVCCCWLCCCWQIFPSRYLFVSPLRQSEFRDLEMGGFCVKVIGKSHEKKGLHRRKNVEVEFWGGVSD